MLTLGIQNRQVQWTTDSKEFPYGRIRGDEPSVKMGSTLAKEMSHPEWITDTPMALPNG